MKIILISHFLDAILQKPSVSMQAACDDVMEPGMIVHIPVSVAEAKISKRFDTIPTATLCPNADEIEYLQRLVMHKACTSYLLWQCSNYPLLSIHCTWIIIQPSCHLASACGTTVFS